ncbi:MAG: hypothetical protein AB7F50_11330 [Fimbriimonadaceae bacterium]
MEDLSKLAAGKDLDVRYYEPEHTAVFVVGDPFMLAARKRRAKLVEALSGVKPGAAVRASDLSDDSRQGLAEF